MTEGQTPAGWYDDGQGQLRWFDGSGWTDHVQALPAAAAPPVEQPAAAAAPSQPVAQPQAVPAAGAPVAAAAATTATPESTAAAALGAPGSHSTDTDPWQKPTPIYRKGWFLALIGLLVLAVIGGIFALSGGSAEDEPGTVATPGAAATQGAAPTQSTAGGAASYGADAATVAAKAGCTGAIPVAAAATGAPQPSSKVTCTLNGTTYTVVTWASATDQASPSALGNAFTKPVTAGTKFYATGEGWTAFDAAYAQAAAQAFATPAGGSVKGVVVVLASPTPAA